MTRDYKARPANRSRRGQRGSGFFWFVSGAVIGAFGVGLAWTLDNAERSAPPPAPSATVEQKPRTTRPQFDFHNILPELEVVVDDEELAAQPPPMPPKPKPPAEPDPAAKPPAEETAAAKPTPGDGDAYLLQVASYRSVGEAERLKAQLALLGIQAQVQQVTINGKDTYHRVRAGPYRGKEATNGARALLSNNGLESITIKLK